MICAECKSEDWGMYCNNCSAGKPDGEQEYVFCGYAVFIGNVETPESSFHNIEYATLRQKEVHAAGYTSARIEKLYRRQDT